MFQIKLRGEDHAFTTSNLTVASEEQILVFKDVSGRMVFVPWSSVSFWTETPRQKVELEDKAEGVEIPVEKEEQKEQGDKDEGKGTKHRAKSDDV